MPPPDCAVLPLPDVPKVLSDMLTVPSALKSNLSAFFLVQPPTHVVASFSGKKRFEDDEFQALVDEMHRTVAKKVIGTAWVKTPDLAVVVTINHRVVTPGRQDDMESVAPIVAAAGDPRIRTGVAAANIYRG